MLLHEVQEVLACGVVDERNALAEVQDDIGDAGGNLPQLSVQVKGVEADQWAIEANQVAIADALTIGDGVAEEIDQVFDHQPAAGDDVDTVRGRPLPGRALNREARLRQSLSIMPMAMPHSRSVARVATTVTVKSASCSRPMWATCRQRTGSHIR